MDPHDPSAGTAPMAAIPAGPDPGGTPNRGGVRTALTSRAAGWVVATLLAGALTGLAVNMATAPSAPSAAGVPRAVVIGPGFAKLRAVGPCQVLAPVQRNIYLPAKGGTKTVTVQPSTPRPIARPAKRVINLPPGVLVPSCGLGLGLVAPGASCNVIAVRPGISFSIHGAGPGQQVIIQRPTPVQVHAKAVQVKPGTQVPAPGPGARLVCSWLAR